MQQIKYRTPFFNGEGKFAYYCYWGTIDSKGDFCDDHSIFCAPASSGFRKGDHQQYVWMKDKNGKEIYEGDSLLEVKNDIGKPMNVAIGQYNVGSDDSGLNYIAVGVHVVFHDGGTYSITQNDKDSFCIRASECIIVEPK